jgi:hypothetical protein
MCFCLQRNRGGISSFEFDDDVIFLTKEETEYFLFIIQAPAKRIICVFPMKQASDEYRIKYQWNQYISAVY